MNFNGIKFTVWFKIIWIIIPIILTGCSKVYYSASPINSVYDNKQSINTYQVVKKSSKIILVSSSSEDFLLKKKMLI
ncbi:MAG: hypothetical protein ACTS81_01950 [Arsenophonus sp. ER-BJ3-MAG3]